MELGGAWVRPGPGGWRSNTVGKAGLANAEVRGLGLLPCGMGSQSCLLESKHA